MNERKTKIKRKIKFFNFFSTYVQNSIKDDEKVIFDTDISFKIVWFRFLFHWRKMLWCKMNKEKCSSKHTAANLNVKRVLRKLNFPLPSRLMRLSLGLSKENIAEWNTMSRALSGQTLVHALGFRFIMSCKINKRDLETSNS